MASFTKVAGDLKNLEGVVSIQDIVTLIKSVDSYHEATEDNFLPQIDTYDKNPLKEVCIETQDLLVDFDYQRFIKLRVLFDHLKGYADCPKQFMPELVGTIDVMERTDGKKYVWDGLRRCILGGLKDVWELPASVHKHHSSLGPVDQQAFEARIFSTKNGRGQETMKVDELWKSDYVARDPRAIEVYNVMKNCNIDKLNVVKNKGYDVGGFGLFKSHVLGEGAMRIESKYFEKASRILQKAWPSPNNVLKGYLFVGFAMYLKRLDDLITECSKDSKSQLPCNDLDTIDHDEVVYVEKFTKYAKNHTQQSITQLSESNKQIESACYNVFNIVIFDKHENSSELKTMWKEQLGLSADEL